METDIRKRIPTFFLECRNSFSYMCLVVLSFAKLAFYVDIGKLLRVNLLFIFQKGAFLVNVMSFPVVGCLKLIASACRYSRSLWVP